jgi:hypothetical protein
MVCAWLVEGAIVLLGRAALLAETSALMLGPIFSV